MTRPEIGMIYQDPKARKMRAAVDMLKQVGAKARSGVIQGKGAQGFAVRREAKRRLRK